jgi:hypothetical protein
MLGRGVRFLTCTIDPGHRSHDLWGDYLEWSLHARDALEHFERVLLGSFSEIRRRVVFIIVRRKGYSLTESWVEYCHPCKELGCTTQWASPFFPP